MELLKKTAGSVPFSQNRSHIRQTVQLPCDFSLVEIRFHYTPRQAEAGEITDAQQAAVIPCWSLGENPGWESTLPERMEYRNVLMISADDANGIRGMTHMHQPDQCHRMGTGGRTTPGFTPGAVPRGAFCVTISVFSVWGTGCDYTLEIWGERTRALEWRPFELHSHTIHSDGVQTVRQIAVQAQALGYGGLALTDHNTISGQRELADAARGTSLVCINGMEWTTFFGHILFLNCTCYLDWRTLTRENFTEVLRGLRAAHPELLVGIAHPFIPGEVGCAGCGFEYRHIDWSLIDYLEVWSETYHGEKTTNETAFRLWTRLLDDGWRITAVSGGDWHRPLLGAKGLSATYLGASEGETAPERYLACLRMGRAVVSAGPVPLLELFDAASGAVYTAGDVLPCDIRAAQVRIRVLEGSVFGEHSAKRTGDSLTLESGRHVLWQGACPAKEERFSLDLSGLRWLRLVLRYASGRTLAFTNAIYRELEE